MKTNLLTTGTALLLALTLSFSAQAQQTTTAMNSTLVPQGWSNLPIVKGSDVKGGLHELGTIAGIGGVTATNLPDERRTDGMVVALFDSNDGDVYKQFILMSGSGDGNEANDVWQEIIVTAEWKASSAYTTGDAVSYQGATYFKMADGNSAATFDPTLWYGTSNGGDANLDSINARTAVFAEDVILADGNAVDGVASTAAEITDGLGASSTEIVSGAALVDYVSTLLSASIGNGDTDGQILIWNDTNKAWEPAGNVIITDAGTVTLGDGTNDVVLDGTSGDITAAGDVTADSVRVSVVETTGNASIGGNVSAVDVSASGNVSAVDVTASGDISGATLDIGSGDLTVDADGNTATNGTLTVEGAAAMNGDVTLNDNAGETTTVNGSLILNNDVNLGGTTVSGISTTIGAGSTDSQLATAKSVYDAVHEADSLITGGTTDGQTLVWNATTGAWEASDALTNDGTDVTATGVVNADALSTTEFTVDTDGNIATSGNVSATGNISGADVAASGTLTVTGAASLSSSLQFSDADAVSAITTSSDGALTATDANLITEGAVKQYVDDQLGSGGSLYYGSDATFATVNTLADNAEIETYTAVAKSAITAASVDIANNEFFFIAVPTNWGALSMFIEESPMFDGFVKQVVEDYNVYVLQFAVPGASTAGLTFAIK